MKISYYSCPFKRYGIGPNADHEHAVVIPDYRRYFNSYDDLSVHDLMLKDKPRVEGYIRAFEANKERLKGERYSTHCGDFISVRFPQGK